MDGGGGGGVAGHHQRFDVVLRHQVRGDGVAALSDKFAAALAIGGVGAVGQIDKALVRQFGAQRLQHAQAANAAVEYADGRRGGQHGEGRLESQKNIIKKWHGSVPQK